MKGLLLREYYTLKQPVTLLEISLLVIVLILMAFTMTDPAENTLIDCRLFGSMISLFSIMGVMAIISGDERSRWLNYILCTPVSRKTYVKECYLLASLIIVCISVITSLFSLVLMLRQDSFVWKEYLLSLSIHLALSAFMTAVLYPLSFRYSSSTGAVVFLVLFVLGFAAVIGFFLATSLTDISNSFLDFFFKTDPGIMALYLFLFSGVIFGASLPLSVSALKHRQF